MEKQFVIPKFPISLILLTLIIVIVEVISYGLMLSVPAVWFLLIFGLFYLSYIALFRRDALPVIFALLFFTAHHSLFYYFNNNFPIALVFLVAFLVYSTIMWLLLHYATHLKPDHHLAYTVICGFMIAEILTLFASMARDWPFRFELASYATTVFSYIFWRFACLSADSMLGWKQFVRMAVLVFVLITLIVLGTAGTPI